MRPGPAGCSPHFAQVDAVSMPPMLGRPSGNSPRQAATGGAELSTAIAVVHSPFLVVKQDNNGTTFVISDIEIPGLTGIDRTAQVSCRPIGPWTRPTSRDIPVFLHPTGSTLEGRSTSDPPF